MILCGFYFPATALAASPAPKQYRIGFTDLHNHVFFLHDFKGKPVVINLWASWCGPCIAEMPALAKLQRDYLKKGLVVLAISEDDTMAQAVAFYKAKSITALSALFDPNHMAWLALTQNLPPALHGIPITVLVNRAGVAIKTYAGPVDWNSPSMQRDVLAIVQ